MEIDKEKILINFIVAKFHKNIKDSKAKPATLKNSSTWEVFFNKINNIKYINVKNLFKDYLIIEEINQTGINNLDDFMNINNVIVTKILTEINTYYSTSITGGAGGAGGAGGDVHDDVQIDLHPLDVCTNGVFDILKYIMYIVNNFDNFNDIHYINEIMCYLKIKDLPVNVPLFFVQWISKIKKTYKIKNLPINKKVKNKDYNILKKIIDYDLYIKKTLENKRDKYCLYNNENIPDMEYLRKDSNNYFYDDILVKEFDTKINKHVWNSEIIELVKYKTNSKCGHNSHLFGHEDIKFDSITSGKDLTEDKRIGYGMLGHIIPQHYTKDTIIQKLNKYAYHPHFLVYSHNKCDNKLGANILIPNETWFKNTDTLYLKQLLEFITFVKEWIICYLDIENINSCERIIEIINNINRLRTLEGGSEETKEGGSEEIKYYYKYLKYKRKYLELKKLI